VIAGAQREAARVGPGGRVDLASPVTARLLTIRVTRVTLAGTYDPYTRDSDLLPVGVSEVTWSGAPPSTSAAADRRLVVPCGSGPTVAAGGRALPTGGSTTYGDVLSGRPVTFTPCGSPTGLALGGRSRIRVDHSPTWDVAGLSIRPVGESVPGTSGGRPAVVDARRSARGNDLTVPVAARAGSAVLWVRQSFNRGWEAELAGRDLRPVVVDGWQQGFVLPAGAAGEVELRFGPDRAYRAGLLVGAVAVLALLVLAVRPARRSTRRPPVLEGGLARMTAPLGALLLVALAGWWGLGVVATVAAVGAAAAVVPAPRPGARTWLLAGLAAAGVAAAGCAVALRPWPSEDYSAGAGWSQALCLLGLGAVWASTLRPSYIGTRLRSRETGRSRTR
jgi:arabinofuranan 3-O-arabinosyltransferase